MNRAASAGLAADAPALARLVRECVAAGVERRALHIRTAALPPGLRTRHQRLIEEALAPLLRPTRARRFELPGGDIVIVSPPPGEHLEAARVALSELLGVGAAQPGPLLGLRLPAEGARLLALVEGALGRAAAEARFEDPGAPLPGLPMLDAAIRSLAQTDLSASLRCQPVWRLPPDAEQAALVWSEMRVHLPDLLDRMLPGTSLASAPALLRLFRQAAERRLLGDLARPEVARGMEPLCLPLGLDSVTEPMALRLAGLIGPEGRAGLCICVPIGDALADPAGLALLRRLSAEHGWTLGVDAVEACHLERLDVGALVEGPVRLQFRPDMLAGEAAERAALDAALAPLAHRLVLMGADAPMTIGWAWRRGIQLFTGRVLYPRH